ncbi:MAG: hypothetical protein JWP13_319, partial [Candidatus Saccharibacteria bacterium]|nr:hypothetical protein [Candidatus Saccharibacteria bacterium]
MKHQDILQAAPQVAVEQETFPPPAFMQEQIDHITGQLGENDREAFLDAVSRYGLARVRVGEKAIGEMGNQIRESEENTAERFDTAHDAVEAWTRRKTNALWRARDEAVNELLYEYVPEDDPKHAVISPAYEI